MAISEDLVLAMFIQEDIAALDRYSKGFCSPLCRLLPTAVVVWWMQNSAAAPLAFLTAAAHAVRREVHWTGLVGAALGAHWMHVVSAMELARQLMWKALAAMLLWMQQAFAAW